MDTTIDKNLGDWTGEENSYEYVIDHFNLKDLSKIVILKHLSAHVNTEEKGFYALFPEQIELNFGAFSHLSDETFAPIVFLSQDSDSVKLTCRCGLPKLRMCTHQAQVLYNLLQRPDLLIFFDENLRKQRLARLALDYGLEQEEDLDAVFELKYEEALSIQPRIPLQVFNADARKEMEKALLPNKIAKLPFVNQKDQENRFVVLGLHQYYSHLVIHLFEAEATKNGKFKNPFKALKPNDFIFKTSETDELKFYSGLSTFQQNYTNDEIELEIEALKSIVKNPLKLPFFQHNSGASGTIQASSIVPVQIHILEINLRLSVNQKDDFYEITGRLCIEDKWYELDQLVLCYQYFIQLKNQLYLIARQDFLRVIGFFKKQNNRLIIHKSKYAEFQKVILVPLEGSIQVDYSYLKPATKAQIEEKGFDLENELLVYLSESEDYILITPVMRYGSMEIPVLSKKQIRAQDKLGNVFTLQRDEQVETQFISDIMRAHPYFYEQLNAFFYENNLDSFYLHRKRFLEEGWFLEAFEIWRKKDIHILGFNQLKNNKHNPFKAEISIEVISGIDWFETKVDVKFGKQVVPLKHLHKSIRNKSKFVTLDDGTQGILPAEWLEKFTAYFASAEVIDDKLLTHKINFAKVTELYEDALLDGLVKNELQNFKRKFEGNGYMEEVAVPKALHAELRHYQRDGLNWLNFLDDFNFGACLADDMGLGKTLQVLAFILSQRDKVKQNTNLVVVPASLVFSWKTEIEKFAPSLEMKIIHGSVRLKSLDNLDAYELIITTYGTLLSDIQFLKQYRFNYVILDESQNIKNPDSQRYKAARMLQARNRIVLTGTPVENNTFDLYGQLSFACPGLFGTKQQFADLYSTPIDQFKDRKRAEELQQKIRPFIMRRTKQQVATELPDKTEIIVYCEMGEEQREVYEANKKEIQDYLLKKTEDELVKSTMHVLKGITRLRQICNSAALLADAKSFVQSSSKIATLLEQIESKVPNHKILVFSQFVGMLDLIKKQLELRQIKYAYLTGQTRNREEVVQSFQRNPEISVFLISLKAGGVGLNLTEADYVYIVDPWWNPAVENQAIDRVYRIGQQKNVIAVRLITPDTIEDKIMKLQANKKHLIQNLVKTDNGFFNSLSKQELLDLL
ncbi:SNF2-related protein [Pedobacter sp. MW01-1-1]|uniref:SNF2-related protein n=1 Tax=Pedobacter sp. MW01-1-1 TaxID=3383027 RepID=UPI003FEFCBF5